MNEIERQYEKNLQKLQQNSHQSISLTRKDQKQRQTNSDEDDEYQDDNFEEPA